MTKAARSSFGGVLKMGPVGGTLADVAELYRIGLPAVNRETEDVTTHDSVGGYEETILLDLINSGEIPLEGYYIAGSATDTALRTAALATSATAPRDFSITAKGAGSTKATITFQGVVTSYTPQDLEIRGKQTFTATIKISGAVTQGTPV